MISFFGNSFNLLKIDWLIDWLTEKLIAWLLERKTDWLSRQPNHTRRTLCFNLRIKGLKGRIVLKSSVELWFKIIISLWISFFSVPGLRKGFLSFRVLYQSGYVVINNYLYYFWNCTPKKVKGKWAGPLPAAFLDKMYDQITVHFYIH